MRVYAEKAGVRTTPHTFRRQAITCLTSNSGLADAEVQFFTAHAERETLAIFRHVALDAELQKRREEAMKGAGL